jgi:hypothetical protein
MQRMLVGMVLFLTLIVGILIIVVVDLSGEISDRRLDRPGATGARTGGGEPTVRPEEVAKLESRLGDLSLQSNRLVDRLGRTESELRAARAEIRRLKRGDAGADEPLPEDGGDPRPFLDDPTRNESGEFDITEEDEEYFVAIQRRIERKRRVTGLTRNVMRRIDRMVEKGEIATVAPDVRTEIEQTVRSFVAAGDDIVTRYVREPVEKLSSDERRDRMSDERDKLVAEAQTALTPLLGESDAALVAQASLQNPWGVRLRGDRSRRSYR